MPVLILFVIFGHYLSLFVRFVGKLIVLFKNSCRVTVTLAIESEVLASQRTEKLAHGMPPPPQY